jgi:hypothetical protein
MIESREGNKRAKMYTKLLAGRLRQPNGLRHELSLLARTLWSSVRIPLRACIFGVCLCFPHITARQRAVCGSVSLCSSLIYIFCEVRVVLKQSRQLVLPRISWFLLWLHSNLKCCIELYQGHIMSYSAASQLMNRTEQSLLLGQFIHQEWIRFGHLSTLLLPLAIILQSRNIRRSLKRSATI